MTAAPICTYNHQCASHSLSSLYRPVTPVTRLGPIAGAGGEMAQGLLPLLCWLSLPPALSVLNGLPLHDHETTYEAVVAVWGRDGSEADGMRCTGAFITPEVVLTAASCLLRATPTGLFEHAACAHGGTGCPVVSPDALEILAAHDLDERNPSARVLSFEFRYSVPKLMPQVRCHGPHAIPNLSLHCVLSRL